MICSFFDVNEGEIGYYYRQVLGWAGPTIFIQSLSVIVQDLFAFLKIGMEEGITVSSAPPTIDHIRSMLFAI